MKGKAMLSKLYDTSVELDDLFGQVKGAASLAKEANVSSANFSKGYISRPAALKLFWAYVKQNDLQDPNDGRVILADSLLKKIAGKNKIKMTEVGGILSDHLFDIE